MKSIFALLLLPVSLLAQGIHFEHGLSWEQIQAKASKENKYIFVDAFTTWCGPCKWMTNTIFPKAEVGTFFNANFISVKLQMDKTDKDNAEVKKWYLTATNFAKQYGISAYPTFLFFNPKGQLVHKMVGGSEADRFIARSSNALRTETQYFTLLDKYRKGNRAPEFLYKAAIAAKEAFDAENTPKIAADYLATQKEFNTKENGEFLVLFSESSTDPAFSILLKNAKALDLLLEKKDATARIVDIAVQEEIMVGQFKQDPQPIEWPGTEEKIRAKYPEFADEIILAGKVNYFELKKDWRSYSSSLTRYMSVFGDNLSPERLNSYAWTVFEHSDDPEVLSAALDWSKRSLGNIDNPMFIDTYANLLYKSGRKEEAINWETKAAELASGDDKANYVSTLEKMKKDEKTWK